MKNDFFGRAGRAVRENGLIIALAVTVCRAAFFSYRTISNINRKLENQRLERTEQNSARDEQAEDVGQRRNNVPLKSPDSSSAPRRSSREDESRDSRREDEKPFSLPVEGKIFSAYSGEELVYNRTLDDWRTHNGIDISATTDEPVKAGADGVVKKVYADGMLGNVIEVDHGSFTARYCGLGKTYVGEGDRVSRGRNLGVIGRVDMEVEEQPHLHLEIILDGRTVNPDSVLS